MTDIRKCYYIYISIMYTHNKTLLLLLKREINLNTLEEKRKTDRNRIQISRN